MAAGLSPIDETPGRDGEAKRLEHVLVNLLAERDRLACRCAEGEEALRAAEEKLKEGEARNAALARQLHAVLPEIEVRMGGGEGNHLNLIDCEYSRGNSVLELGLSDTMLFVSKFCN